MAALVWLLPAVVLGCLLTLRFAGLAEFRPRWGAALLIFGAGSLAGVGLTSGVFFLCLLCVPGLPALLLGLEMAALAWLIRDVVRRRGGTPVERSGLRPFPLNLPLMLGLGLALVAVTLAFMTAWQVNPDGGWDAWAIWNLRARYLAAGGELAARAWSPVLSYTQRQYPLLTSGFIARCWTFGHSLTTAVPMALAYLIFLAMVALAAGGVACLRSRPLGLLFGLALMASPAMLREVPAEYADIPVAAYMLGAVLLALLDRPVLAGALAGFAAWTKDEGMVFVAVLIVATALFRRRQVPRLIVGAAPAVLLALVFRLLLVGSAAWGGGPGFAPQPLDPVRLRIILGAFVDGFSNMRVGWYHPVLPLLVLALALRFERERLRDVLFSATAGALMLLSYFAGYMLTPVELSWHLGTSLDRLLVQVWPLLVLTVFAGLRAPESAAVAIPAPKAALKRKNRK